ncbi:Peptidyl-prolyl cis-trans isomerase [Vibrio fluvialis I21563]|jgi:hypothetical protein|nr:Peptidyl-prolyl cis-trans isomerase [Vibrio fluvialis I21563]
MYLGVFPFMKKLLFPIFAFGLLAGCSSSLPTANLEQINDYTGGQSMGDATSFYWYTERQNQPSSAADYVSSERFGWYQSSYRWDEGQVREVVREGVQPKNQTLVPYRVQLRFNKDGEAVYQQYRVDGKVLPLNQDQLSHYQQQASALAEMTKSQDSQGLELIQGVWDGEVFETCTGREYRRIEFNQTLPNFVVNRLSSLDSYVAFLGKIRNDKVYVEELLMLADDNHDCISRPNLISE